MDYNLAKLERLRNPVIVLSDQHECAAAAKGMEEEAEGLSACLYLSISSWLRLIYNLLTSFGLVNGTMGTLHEIVWRPSNDPCTTLSFMLLFTLD